MPKTAPRRATSLKDVTASSANPVDWSLLNFLRLQLPPRRAPWLYSLNASAETYRLEGCLHYSHDADC